VVFHEEGPVLMEARWQAVFSDRLQLRLTRRWRKRLNLRKAGGLTDQTGIIK
jgi:hypothetical protein